MPLTLQNIRDTVRRVTGVDDIDYPDTVIDGFINRAYWELDAKFPFREKDSISSFNTIIGTNLYTLAISDFDYLRNISIIDNDGQSHNIDRMSEDYLAQVYNTNDDLFDVDKVRYLRRNVKDVYIYPTPDDVYVINIRYEKILADLVNSTDNPAYPRSWGEIVEQGAIWRCFQNIGDTKRMNDSRNAQVALVESSVPTESKEEFDSSRAHVEVPSRRY